MSMSNKDDSLGTKIIDYLIDIKGELGDVKVEQAKHSEILEKQEDNLREHIRRTELLEEANTHLESRIKPLEDRWTKFDGALKLIGIISLVLGVIATALKIISFFI